MLLFQTRSERKSRVLSRHWQNQSVLKEYFKLTVQRATFFLSKPPCPAARLNFISAIDRNLLRSRSFLLSHLSKLGFPSVLSKKKKKRLG